jgi:hypothetical protein
VIPEKWPYVFNKARDFKMIGDMKRDFFFDYKKRQWIQI